MFSCLSHFVLTGRHQKETVFPGHFRFWLLRQASVCFPCSKADLRIHHPLCEPSLDACLSFKWGSGGFYMTFLRWSWTGLLPSLDGPCFQRRGEPSWTGAGQGGRRVTEETKRLCKWKIPCKHFLCSSIGRDILLEDENEPPMAGGRRERRPNRWFWSNQSPLNRCLVDKLSNMREMWHNISGVLLAKWATKGKEMSQVDFLQIQIASPHLHILIHTSQAWLGARV